MSDTYRGIVGAPTTPFNSNNEVDLHIFAKQINFLIESGVRIDLKFELYLITFQKTNLAFFQRVFCYSVRLIIGVGDVNQIYGR